MAPKIILSVFESPEVRLRLLEPIEVESDFIEVPAPSCQVLIF